MDLIASIATTSTQMAQTALQAAAAVAILKKTGNVQQQMMLELIQSVTSTPPAPNGAPGVGTRLDVLA